MKTRLLALAALASLSLHAQADTIGLWDFNSYSCASPCATLPKATQTANGGSMSVLGGISFVSITSGVTGSAINTSGYAAQGTGNLGSGVQFMIDTTGYTGISLSFAQRNSSTASAWSTLQYTVNGSDWITATTFEMPNGGANPSFVTGRTFDFSGISAADNNESFGIRLVASWKSGTTSYVATNASTGSNYATTGTIRYDNVLLSGTAIPESLPVPEPESYALMLAGLAAISMVVRRRAGR